jgi:hypothetical protein
MEVGVEVGEEAESVGERGVAEVGKSAGMGTPHAR